MSGGTTCTTFVGDNDVDEADLLAIDLESIEENVRFMKIQKNTAFLI